VPHAERANTASFLEEVITYIQGLQKRIAELEQLTGAAGNPVTGQAAIGAAALTPASLVAPAAISGAPSTAASSQATMAAPTHTQAAGQQGPLDARDKRSFPCTAAPEPHPFSLPAELVPPNSQPSTPPAVSGHASEQGGELSPASSEGSGVPLKKRRVVEGGSG
jgi:hypothetical protein